jgi:NADH:ubiquinone oxidoreductase subunit
MEVSGQLHAPAAIPPEKEPLVPTGWEKYKDTKHTDKCSNNKTKATQKQNDETKTNTFSKYCEDNIKFDIKYIHIIIGPYNKQWGKNLHIL